MKFPLLLHVEFLKDGRRIDFKIAFWGGDPLRRCTFKRTFMKYLMGIILSVLTFIILSWGVISSAVEVKFYYPPDLRQAGHVGSDVLVNTQVLKKGQETVGELTVRVLTENHIEFKGSELGIFSIFGTPVGDPALEIISDTEMKAYGWCFWLDGVLSETRVFEQGFHSPDQVLEWRWSYAHYKNGDWIGQCIPVDASNRN